MRSSHKPGAVSVMFDDPNLVSHAGLLPVMRLAENAGVVDQADALLTLGSTAGSNAGAKVSSIVAGMVTGADSIEDLDVIRHGALPRLFTGIRAPSTLGTFLRDFTIGHNAQLENVLTGVLARLRRLTPLLPGIDTLAFLDVWAGVVSGDPVVDRGSLWQSDRSLAHLAQVAPVVELVPTATGDDLVVLAHAEGVPAQRRRNRRSAVPPRR